MAYQLPALPYPTSALEPHIDAKTMEIHHGKHHNAYVTKLNEALEGHADLAAKPIERLLREIEQTPEKIRQAVINNGGGHANHSLFWQIMGPNKGGAPSGKLADAINKRLRERGRLQEDVQQQRRHPLRQRLVMAGCRRRKAASVFHAEPGFAADEGPHADPRLGCVGARVLPELPESPPGLCFRVVESGGLGQGRRVV